MKRIKMIFLLIAFLFGSVEPGMSQDANRTGNTAPVRVLFSAIVSDKQIFSALQKEDIRVLEDGVQQEILSFQQRSNVPLSIALMVDASASQGRSFAKLKAAAALFFDSVSEAGKDLMAVISFTGKPTLEQTLTADLPQVRKVIEHLQPVQLPRDFLEQVKKKQPKIGSDLANMGSTAIWDAVWFTNNEVLATSPGEKRRVAILITDGVDSSSLKKMSEAIDQAVKSNVLIYSIGIGDERMAILDQTALRRLSEQTGGRAFFPKSLEQMKTGFKELREPYVLAYSSSSKRHDSYRKIKIEIVNPDLRKRGWRLLYQERYLSK
jgi:Ca-activated chloride channel family protein